MIKVTYYIGTNDKDTCKKELLDIEFLEIFDELFGDYTLQRAQGVYTMKKTGTIIKENTFIVTIFIEENDIKAINDLKIYNDVATLKNRLNQESILVEVCQPEVMFL